MYPLNMQPVEKPVVDPEGRLDVVSIWYTIQGEGPFAGRPAVFVRLAGCNLQCPSCDTDYTTERMLLTPQEILAEVASLRPLYHAKWLLVITGGEPFRQKLRPFISLADTEGYTVQVETNGTVFNEDFNWFFGLVSVVCSPKTPTVNAKVVHMAAAWKYVLDADHVDPDDGLPTEVLGSGLRPARRPSGSYGEIYVQPFDSGDPVENKRHIQAAVESCLKYGYRLSLQTHKIVGLE